MRVEDPDIKAGIAAPLAISDARAAPRAGELGDWFSALHGNAWLIANVSGIFITLFLVSADNRAHGVVWGLFMGINAGLFNHLAARSLRQSANPFDRNTILVVFAGILGGGWAIAAWLVAAGGSALDLASAIATSYVVVVLGMSVFAHQGSAYFVLLGAYGAPMGWLLLERFGAIATWASATLCLVPVLLAARLQHHAIAAMSNLLATLSPAPDVAPITAPAEYDDFVDQARSRIGHLRHASADHARLQATFSALPEAVIRTDAQGRIEDMNRIAEVLTGFTAGEARGRTLGAIACLQCPGDGEVAGRISRAVHDSGETVRGDDRTNLRRRDGAIRGVDYAMSPLGDERERSGAVLLLRDVTERRNLRNTTARRVNQDSLTKLGNRTDFETRLGAVLDRDDIGDPILHGLCVIDLDHFKLINERYGAAAGDFVLQRVADALKRKLRGVDPLARLDADRFGVLLLNCAFDKARLIAEGLRDQIASLDCTWQDVKIDVQASVGVIEVRPGQTNLTELLSSVDYACLRAKRDGGNHVHAARADDDRCRNRDPNYSRIKEIETALRYDHFELFFQSLHPIGSDVEPINYCELSLRMRTDSGQILAPPDFIPVAERYHLLPDVDRWIVKATIDALRRSHPKLHRIDIVAIKVSAQAVSDETFLDYVVSLLSDSEIPKTRLCFELAESHLIKQWDRACSFIATLKNLGCHIALDDFGLGTHSFQLLKKLPVDFLKIHEDFIRNLAHNSIDYEVVLGILRVAKALRIRTIAGGYTNSATRDVLRDMGVDFAQSVFPARERP